jgi:hypothetical protein
VVRPYPAHPAHFAAFDSLHTEERARAEFQFATQLFCPECLNLVYGLCCGIGTAEGALWHIEDAGHDFVCPWKAESGMGEGDHPRLVIVENQPKPSEGQDTPRRQY